MPDDGDLPFAIGEYNLDDDLIAATRGDHQPRLAVRRLPGVRVVVGRGSKIPLEIDIASCHADRVLVQRRSGGGCAVVIDPGNLVLTLTLPSEGLGGNKRRFAAIAQWLIDALARSGIPGVTMQGSSDLALGDRKISGSCIHQSRDLVWWSGTLLVAPDLALIDRYLLHPPREPDWRRGRPHREFVTGLAHLLPPGDPVATLQQRLLDELQLHRLDV